MLKHLAVLALLAPLTACPATTGTTTTDPTTGVTTTTTSQAVPKTLIDACTGFADAENTVAGYVESGTIKSEAFSSINKARTVGNQFCAPGTPVPTDLTAATNAVLDATAQLLLVAPKQGAK